jgi:heterodisulfide reductase subunit A
MSELQTMGQEIRAGVYICRCGLNIASAVDCQAVAEWAADLEGVTISRDNPYVCSEPGQQLIKDDIVELGLNRIVIASCSPRLHEPTFRRMCLEAGLNPYLFEMANIREQCSWVHPHQKEAATEKAKDLVKMALNRVRRLQPQEELEVPVAKSSLVIGCGVAGIQAALDLADNGFLVHVVEKQASIGGVMAQLDKTYPTMDCSI